MKFVDWLLQNTVDDLLLSKTTKSDAFVTLSSNETVWDAFWILGSNDISAVSVYDERDATTFRFILTINDLLLALKIHLGSTENAIKDEQLLKCKFLDTPVGELMVQSQYKYHPEPIYVDLDCNLRELIRLWISQDMYASSHRVFVGCARKVKDVLTVTDFLHYCFVNAHKLDDVMQVHALSALYPGSKTPSPLSSSGIIDAKDTAWSALNKILDFFPTHVVGITDSLNGNLIGYLSSMDFMPSETPADVFSLVSHLDQSVASYVKNICKGTTRMIDAVTFRDQMTLEQVLERLLKLRVHMLWRIAWTGQVIGVVTAMDILMYFNRRAELG